MLLAFGCDTGGAGGGETGPLLSEGPTSSGQSAPSRFAAPRSRSAIVDGFALSITRHASSGLTLTWEDEGVSQYEVWSSTDPYFTPGDAGSTLLTTIGQTTYDIAEGPETYYRIRAIGGSVEFSTTAGQLPYDLYPEWSKLGWCLVTEVDTWSELQADMPSGPTQAVMWDASEQDWDHGASVVFGPGDVVAVKHVDPVPNVYRAIGLVPTAPDINIQLLPGDNLVTTLPLRFGPVMASELLASVEHATEIGSWDPVAEVTRWHSQDGDWLLSTCSPVHVKVSAPSPWPPPAPQVGGGTGTGGADTGTSGGSGADTDTGEGSGTGDETGSLATYYRDQDGDGFGDPADSVDASSAPAGYVSDDSDCDDGDDTRFPGAPELCDTADNDCDASVDELDDATDDATQVACDDAQQATPTDLSAVDGSPTATADAVGQAYRVLLADVGGLNGGSITFAPPTAGDYVMVSSLSVAVDIVDQAGDPVSTTTQSTAECSGILESVQFSADGPVEIRFAPGLDAEATIAFAPLEGVTFFPDTDGDGFGSGEAVRSCTAPSDYADNDDDCDDDQPRRARRV